MASTPISDSAIVNAAIAPESKPVSSKSPSRQLALDGLRGWLLIVIACNHLWGEFVRLFTHMPFGYFSAAQSFVMLSGFVAYLVYRRDADNPQQLKSKVWKRTAVIYGFHVVGSIVALSLTQLLPIYPEVWLEFYTTSNWQNAPWQTLILLVTLLELPAYHDILMLYMIPMLFLPFAIIAIEKGYLLWVMAVSLLVWLAAQWSGIWLLEPILNIWFEGMDRHHGYTDPFAWQLYFYVGVAFCALQTKHGVKFEFASWLKWSVVALALAMMISRHYFGKWVQIESLPLLFGGAGEAPLLHVLNLALFAYIFKLVCQYWRSPFIMQFPVFIGQHALPVFAFHSVVLFFIAPAVEPWVTTYWWADVLACAAFVALLYVPAKLDAWYKTKKRQTRL